jgi:hypothetical protein
MPALPEALLLDEVALAELLDVIEQLRDLLPVGTLGETEGDRDAWERANCILERYKPARGRMS